MTPNHRPHDLDRLEPSLEAAVWSVLAEPVPEDAVERVKTRARQLPAIAVPPLGAPEICAPSRKPFRPRAAALIAATALAALVVAGSTLWLDRSGSRAFAQVIQKVNAAASVQFEMTTRLGRDTEIESQVYLKDGAVRIEQFGGKLIQIGDLQRNRGLFLDTSRKLAQQAELDQYLAKGFANPIEQLRTAESKAAEAIGEEYLNGRRTRVFRLQKVSLLGMQGDRMLVWVDAESQLPAKISFSFGAGKRQDLIEFKKLVWNEPLDDALFSLDVPAGYESGIVVVTPKPQPKPASPASLDAPNVAQDGILSRDRVPARIVWGASGTTITALMRDPETTSQPQANELRQWDATTGKLLWSKSVGGTGSLAISADGKSLATAIGYELQVVDTASGEARRKWEGDALLPPVAFSPDGAQLAAAMAVWAPGGAEESGGVQIWDIAQGSLVRSVTDEKPTTFVRYSLNGKYVASASNGGPVKLWNASNGELARIFPGFRPAFSPDGHMIACAFMESGTEKKRLAKIKIYDLQTAALVKTLAREQATPESWLLSVAYSPDGRLLAAADWDGTVTLWDAATGQVKQTIRDHSGGVHTAVFSPDGTTLATGSEDKMLRLWKLPSDLLAPAAAKQ